jgi:hypothetical protein
MIVRANATAAEVEQYINAQPGISIKKILVPVKDKRKLREVLEEHEITSVINIARSRAADTLDPDDASRRAAVDFGIPVRCHFYSTPLALYNSSGAYTLYIVPVLPPEDDHGSFRRHYSIFC